MSKPIHPIMRIVRALGIWDTRLGQSGMRGDALLIARHVKPLLDALDSIHRDAFDHAPGTVETCQACRLLTAWRAKL